VIAGSLLARIRSLFRDAAASGVAMSLYVANDPSSGVGEAGFLRALVACAIQLQRDVAPAWGRLAPTIVPIKHGDPIPQSTTDGPVAVLSVVGKIPDDPTAQGWHQALGSGQPFDGYVSTEGVDADGFSEVLSHELTETLVDPGTDRIAVAPNGDQHPIEACDMVQARNDSERVPISLVNVDGSTTTEYLSNFVFPSAFGLATPPGAPQPEGKYDFLGALSAPFTRAPGGYEAITHADGTTEDVFGEARTMLSPRALHADSRVQVRKAKAAA